MGEDYTRDHWLGKIEGIIANLRGFHPEDAEKLVEALKPLQEQSTSAKYFLQPIIDLLEDQYSEWPSNG